MAGNRDDFFKFGEGTPPKAPDFVKLREPSAIRQTPSAPIPPPAPPKTSSAPPERRPKKGFDLLKMLNLRSLEFDADRKVIIAVILLLLGETDDELLLLALLYIML